jgi:DNA gyrase/topoisomerase IV subunit B
VDYSLEENFKKLRYGGIIILTDQDTDGTHIKGLLINLIHYFWPSLLKYKGFIQSLATPIVKTWKKTDTKKTKSKVFYTISEYTQWIKKTLKGDASKWCNKYYKGLGTSTSIKDVSIIFGQLTKIKISKIIQTINPILLQTKMKMKTKTKTKTKTNTKTKTKTTMKIQIVMHILVLIKKVLLSKCKNYLMKSTHVQKQLI